VAELRKVLTAAAHVYALHELIGYLRGEFPGAPVVAVGHSAGSGVVLQEAADYADVDGVVIIGLLHQPYPAGAPLFATFYPADVDPKFVNAGYDAGYVTTRPGTRGSDFYNTAVADPTVILTDEVTKSTGSTSELGSGDIAFLASTSQAIQVPVLVAVGQYDNAFCYPATDLSCASPADVLARERADYSPAAQLEGYVVAGSGHSINLHPNARDWFVAANDWVARHVPARP
jgi:alpha-beta hydrolase superfamily lysophospholipase